MKRTSSIIKYLKGRAASLSSVIQYYDSLERDKGWLTSDQKLSYDLAVARLDEIEKLVTFIEG